MARDVIPGLIPPLLITYRGNDRDVRRPGSNHANEKSRSVCQSCGTDLIIGEKVGSRAFSSSTPAKGRKRKGIVGQDATGKMSYTYEQRRWHASNTRRVPSGHRQRSLGTGDSEAGSAFMAFHSILSRRLLLALSCWNPC